MNTIKEILDPETNTVGRDGFDFEIDGKKIKIYKSYAFSSPYGKATLQRYEYSVWSGSIWNFTVKTIKNITAPHFYGEIVKFLNKKEFVIGNYYPHQQFKSFRSAVRYVVKNKLVYCS